MATDTSKQNKRELESNGTIGSRLRKRRRTGSVPAERTPPTAKVAHTRNTKSPDSERSRAEMSRRRSILSSGSLANGKHRKSPSLTPLSSDSLSLAPSHSLRAPSPVEQPPTVTQQAAVPVLLSQQHYQRPLSVSSVPDVNALLNHILQYSARVDKAKGGYSEIGHVNTESLRSLGASLLLKTESLPILDNLVRSFRRLYEG